MNIMTPPKIMSISPKNQSIDVPVNLDSIVIGFSTDLDPNHIRDHVRLQTQSGEVVKISFRYKSRTLNVVPKNGLSPNTSYQLMLHGDGNVNDEEVHGIRSVVGVPLAGTAVIHFTTTKNRGIQVPNAIEPANRTTIESFTAFKWKVAADDLTPNEYEIEVSKSNTMSNTLWSTRTTDTTATPDEEFGEKFTEGMYYWRVRGLDSDENVGEWSELFIFNIKTFRESPVVEEDTLPPEIDMNYDPYVDAGYIEILDVFPTADYSNVGTNLKTIFIRVLGEVKETDEVEIEMFGESVLGEGVNHGSTEFEPVMFTTENGITTIEFVIKPLDL